MARDRIVLDPGFGFGKTVEHNKALFRALPRACVALGYPVLAGVSRKKMIGDFTGRARGRAAAGSVAAALLAVQNGAAIVRVHDVKETVDAINVWPIGTRRTDDRKYFGTDGIRGRVGLFPITPDFVMKLGYCAGKVLSRADIAPPHRSRPAVLIGKDTRISGYMLESALEVGPFRGGRGYAARGPDAHAGGRLPHARRCAFPRA